MIIGLSGKKQSGKDTVCKIIQYLVTGGMNTYIGETEEESILGFIKYHSDCIDENGREKMSWIKKQFADKLKQMLCLLINCTMEQLEDNDFKEKQLGEEWTQYIGINKSNKMIYLNGQKEFKTLTEEMLKGYGNYVSLYEKRLTPRLLLQLLGTDCGRKLIHPNIWVNSLMSEYKPKIKDTGVDIDFETKTVWNGGHLTTSIPIQYSNWIITDVRFPNELKAIEDKEGIVIRVNRSAVNLSIIDIMRPLSNHVNYGFPLPDVHESEIALDTHKFKYTIDNSGTIEQLVNQVRLILKDLKII